MAELCLLGKGRKTMMLKSSIFLVFILACLKVQGVSGVARNVITWDDFKVDELNIASNVDKIIVVDQSGKGDSTNVQGAVDMVPDNNSQRVKIYIHPGTYRERVHVPINKPFISFIGKVDPAIYEIYGENEINKIYESVNIGEFAKFLPIITNSTMASYIGPNGKEYGTFSTATVWVESDFFCATGLTIENLVPKIGEERQAVALMVDSKQAMFYRIRLVGEQDTLLDNKGTHYFYQSYIQGSVDFIFGQAKSLYNECTLYTVADGAIAAHHRDTAEEDTGFSFVNCKITGIGSVILGRPWGNYSTAVFSYCNMDNIIQPLGWNDWDKPYRQRTAIFGEYQNTGLGSNMRGRVTWSKKLTYEQAKPYLSIDYINKEKWLDIFGSGRRRHRARKVNPGH